ncbi:MAG TPA: response regulator transcription factor [Thermoleophilaceae bacterium]
MQTTSLAEGRAKQHERGADGNRRAEPHPRLRVLVADEQEIVHWGFRSLLTAQDWVERYIGAQTAEETIELVRAHEPHVAMIDVMVGEDSGAALCQRVHEVCARTRVLLMSRNGAITAQSARAAGALGSVPKDWSAQDLASAARMVALGMTVFAPDRDQPGALLSERERQVLHLIAIGSTNREIAERLFLSPHTVKDHTSTLYKKVKAKNRADAIQRAQRLGLLG